MECWQTLHDFVLFKFLSQSDGLILPGNLQDNGLRLSFTNALGPLRICQAAKTKSASQTAGFTHTWQPGRSGFVQDLDDVYILIVILILKRMSLKARNVCRYVCKYSKLSYFIFFDLYLHVHAGPSCYHAKMYGVAVCVPSCYLLVWHAACASSKEV